MSFVPFVSEQSEQQKPQERRTWAEQLVQRFEDRFGQPHKDLACHAALPLVLTPELLDYLRNYFFRGRVPWEAEADLLLSELCQPAGYEQYVMDINVRVVLLRYLQETFGAERMQDVAELLLNYVHYLKGANPYLRERELKTQSWSAMVFIDRYRGQMTQEIAAAFGAEMALSETAASGDSGLINRAELSRLVKLTRIFSEQLQQEAAYQDLIHYAELVGDLLRGPQAIGDLGRLQQEYRVGDQVLPSVAGLLSEQTQQALAELASSQDETDSSSIPPLQTARFTVGVLRRQEEETEPEPDSGLQKVDFTYVEVEWRRGISGRKRPKIRRRSGQLQQWVERLNEQTNLEMVLIPQGRFQMGAPAGEGNDTEKPQHLVTVQPFLMGKYAVTQAQYQAVMGTNPATDYNRPRFVGANKPVVGVSWRDAVTFCQRLSELTGRNYRLPSEAEWEYACRAGTETPFYFGETISAELANYDARGTYGDGLQGEFRNGLIEVGSLNAANRFGLHDMHGNVWEWCADHWHSNYNGALEDGSAWLSDNDKASRLLRGGSWNNLPNLCRSDFRHFNRFGLRNYIIGFRVVCSAARLSP